ncbi:hypothetical protein D3C87_2116360 [compost metagenome]
MKLVPSAPLIIVEYTPAMAELAPSSVANNFAEVTLSTGSSILTSFLQPNRKMTVPKRYSGKYFEIEIITVED